MTSYEHLFESQLPIINTAPWMAATMTSAEDEREMEEIGWEVIHYSFRLSELAEFDVEAFDPGYASMGICTIHYGQVDLYQCDMRAGNTKPSAPEIARRIYSLYLALPNVGYANHSVIENAAFGKPHGQANLGLVRGILSGLIIGKGGGLVFYTPSQFKKLVHGTDKVDYHKKSKHYKDAVAAYAMALARCKQLEKK